MPNSPPSTEAAAVETHDRFFREFHQHAPQIIEQGPALYDVLAGIGDRQRMAQCIGLQAMARFRLGRTAEAIRFLAEWEGVLDELDVPQETVRMLNLRGLLAKAEHDYRKAIGYFRRGLELSDDSSLRVNFCGNLGRIFNDLGDYGTASELFLQALQEVKTKPQPAELARTLTNLADTCHLQDQHDLALRYLDEAIPYAIETKFIGLQVQVHLFRARTLEKLERIAEQGEALAEAGRLVEESPDLKAGFLYQRDVVRMECAKYELQHGDQARGQTDLETLIRGSHHLSSREYTDACLTLADHADTERERAMELLQSALASAAEGNLRTAEAAAHAGLAARLRTTDADTAYTHLACAREIEQARYSEESARRLQAVGLHRETRELQQKLSAEQRVREETARLLTEVEMQKNRAEEANRAKTAILSLAAHDLRNQVGSLLLGAETVAHALEEPDEVLSLGDLVVLIMQSGRDLRELLDSLLDYAAIQEGTLSSRPESVDLNELVAPVVATWEKAAVKKDQTLALCASRETAMRVHVDPARVKQVLHNLLSNAVKYSPKGSPLEVGVTRKTHQARLEVRDRGPGIHAADQTRLFAAFQPLDNRPTGDESSTGLGLHIARAIIENEGGQIGYQARDDDGGGSIFWVELPLTM